MVVRAERVASARPRTARALDQPGAQATPSPQPCLQAGHAPVVVRRVVVVAEKMQQAVEREHLQLGAYEWPAAAA